jgi:hypothetical protein
MGDSQKDSKKIVRKNASNACKSCRESKTKVWIRCLVSDCHSNGLAVDKLQCDNQQPCGGCIKKDKECVYDSRDDKRR